MDNPQAQEASPPASTTFQASTANPTVPVTPGVNGFPPAGPAGAGSQSPGQPLTGSQQENSGVGVEGETSVWIGHYSLKNFLGRILLRTAVTIGWLFLLSYFSQGDPNTGRRGWTWLVWLGGAAVLVYWLTLGWQFLLARKGHRYELTNRRLFVDTGFLRRRRDQVELLRVQDVYVKQQGLMARLLDLGTVVIETSEEKLPVHYLAGVDGPNGVMDLIWHHARKERDLRSVKVDEV